VTQKSKEEIGTLGPGGGSFVISDLVHDQFNLEDQRGLGATFRDVYTLEESGEIKYFSTYASKYDGIVSGGFRLFVDDVVIYRYADVLLLKAEIKNALGQDPSDEINQIRMRAYGENFKDFQFVNGSRES